MTPVQWNLALCDLLDGRVDTIASNYFKEVWKHAKRYAVYDEKPTPSELSLILSVVMSFSIAHQKYQDLTGRVNLVLPSDKPLKALEAYLRFQGRSILSQSSITFAAIEASSWDCKGVAEQLPQSYVIFYDCDALCQDYKSLTAFMAGVERVSPRTQGLILVSKKPLDEHTPAVSANADKTRSIVQLGFTVLDPVVMATEGGKDGCTE